MTHGPKRVGRSRQGAPGQSFHSIPLMMGRWSSAGRPPLLPLAGRCSGSSGSRRCHCASVKSPLLMSRLYRAGKQTLAYDAGLGAGTARRASLGIGSWSPPARSFAARGGDEERHGGWSPVPSLRRDGAPHRAPAFSPRPQKDQPPSRLPRTGPAKLPAAKNRSPPPPQARTPPGRAAAEFRHRAPHQLL